MNITNKKRFNGLFLVVLCSLSFAGFGQKQSDAVAWLSLKIDKKITNRFSLGIMNQTTLNQNFSEIGASYLDFGIDYKLSKHFTIGGNYRVTQSRNLQNQYQFSQRFYTDISFSKGFKKFVFQFRSRFQFQYYGIDLSDNFRSMRSFNRNRISIKYTINRVISPYIFLEQFYRLNNLYRTEAFRGGLGLSYKFNLQHKLDFYFVNQRQVNRKNPRMDYIYGIMYSFKF